MVASTPADVHHGRARAVLGHRQRAPEAAWAAHSERFVRGIPEPGLLLPGVSETDLVMYRFSRGALTPLMGTVDCIAHTITVTTTSFSIFIVGLEPMLSCGNRVHEPGLGEDCDARGLDDGVRCSSTCTCEAVFSTCGVDSDVCTTDGVCDGAGTCICT